MWRGHGGGDGAVLGARSAHCSAEKGLMSGVNGPRPSRTVTALQRSRALYISTALQRSTLYILYYTLPQDHNMAVDSLVCLRAGRTSL